MTDATTTTATYTSAALQGRELEWAKNSEQLLAEHARINTADDNQTVIVRTRFPPEPNGYLHIGHAKSMYMNFQLAFDKLNVPAAQRRTIFRYDDTNPDAESVEYMDSLRRDVHWLGWTPERTTYSSDYFQQLYDFAVQLVKDGKAYVCDMTKAEMEVQRELCRMRALCRNTGQDADALHPIPSPDVIPGRNRNTHVQRNLELLDKMRMGFFDEGAYTLRLKMDLESSNPNMYDLVAYRIKYTEHPHSKHGWCIYPSYDWTHGTCDSLEHIDYSICTLEFETRRECYYWILHNLGLYRPKVYEMSRLNVQYTVLSKRRLIQLVDHNNVRGWDDPRMPTVSGLRRRGYTPGIIHAFCADVGATRASNVVEMVKLQQTARVFLAASSTRCMAVLNTPIRIVITNWDELMVKDFATTFDVSNVATDASQGSHPLTLTREIYIDASDFRMQDSPTYYGLAPKKLNDMAVGLKYQGGNIVCHKVIQNNNNNGEEEIVLECTLDVSEGRAKPKTHISWVPSNAIPCEVRVYDNLFTVPEPSDLWQDELNPTSEIVHLKAMVDPSVDDALRAAYPNLGKQQQPNNADDDDGVISKWKSNLALQFERLGYFCVDYETTYHPDHNKQGRLIFNRTVTLKEEVFKKELSQAEQDAIAQRKANAQQDLRRKAIRMQIAPERLFRDATEYQNLYSEYDATTGVPTVMADGKTPVTKSMMKKLTKEQAKHKKQQAAWEKQQQNTKK